ncbi:hypothetical protein SLA2020_063900 [Shorea laevis]
MGSSRLILFLFSSVFLINHCSAVASDFRSSCVAMATSPLTVPTKPTSTVSSPIYPPTRISIMGSIICLWARVPI